MSPSRRRAAPHRCEHGVSDGICCLEVKSRSESGIKTIEIKVRDGTDVESR